MSGEGYKIGAAAAKVSVILESGTQTARTNSDAASMTTAKASSNPDVACKTKNEMMFSTKQLSVAAVGYDPNGKNDRGEKALVIKLRCTNKTKKDLQLNFGPFGVNRFFGYFVKSQGTDTIPAEKTVYASLVIDQAALDQLEAASVDEIIGKYYVRGEKNESGGFTIYPTGKTAQEITPAKSFSEEDCSLRDRRSGSAALQAFVMRLTLIFPCDHSAKVSMAATDAVRGLVVSLYFPCDRSENLSIEKRFGTIGGGTAAGRLRCCGRRN